MCFLRHARGFGWLDPNIPSEDAKPLSDTTPQNAQSNSRRNAASLRALRYEPEARLKNGSSRRLTLPYSRPARQRDTPQKNDFAVHDFAKPSPALIETPLHDPRGSAPAAQELHGLNVAACRKSSTFLVATMAPCLTAMASIKLSQSA